MVLLKNNNSALPHQESQWGSTNPIYGGTGSGSLSDNPDDLTPGRSP